MAASATSIWEFSRQWMNSLPNFLTLLRKEGAPETIEVLENEKAPNCCESPIFLYILFPLIGWGIPIAMVVGFAAYSKLGYAEDYDGGEQSDNSITIA